jgi:Fe-S-cluster containining protein
MPFHLAPGLTREAATHICMHECRALCCRGPLILQLTPPEAQSFRKHASALGVELRLREAEDGSASVCFPEHAGERCPMLDADTSACRIYADRPERCRSFPEKPRAECAISGFVSPGSSVSGGPG